MPARLHSKDDVVAKLAEVFREHGYGGAALSQLAAASGWGKGSLYHAFPGGKEQMAAEVLDRIDAWFASRIFAPLEAAGDARSLDDMLDACLEYFHGGGRICLVGMFALADSRDRFAARVNGYFRRWEQGLCGALTRLGASDPAGLAEETLSRIQGGLVLARAWDEPAAFQREIDRLRRRLTPNSGR
jgi:TetR/AcrR family transcriptional regulator, lmrAB and yxaGH operons repressor